MNNLYSWTKLANVLYIDQPLGTGFSGGKESAKNDTDVLQHFYQWLTAFLCRFSRIDSQAYLSDGESYAGIYESLSTLYTVRLEQYNLSL